jgi:hypothetical protein
VEHGFDAADLPLLDLEQLGHLPCPVDPIMVEEHEGERDATLPVDRNGRLIGRALPSGKRRRMRLVSAEALA